MKDIKAPKKPEGYVDKVKRLHGKYKKWKGKRKEAYESSLDKDYVTAQKETKLYQAQASRERAKASVQKAKPPMSFGLGMGSGNGGLGGGGGDMFSDMFGPAPRRKRKKRRK